MHVVQTVARWLLAVGLVVAAVGHLTHQRTEFRACLDLDGGGVHYVAQSATPLGPPRRYDTRFFVTAMPEGQVPLHDDDEAVDHEWVRATDALAANERGEMIMMTPTLSMLQRLRRARRCPKRSARQNVRRLPTTNGCGFDTTRRAIDGSPTRPIPTAPTPTPTPSTACSGGRPVRDDATPAGAPDPGFR